MSDFIFQSYTATPGEKHLGIAQIKCWNKIVLRYKIVLTKDGVNSFPTAASYKIIDEGGERYVPAFMPDSMSDKEEIEALIKMNVKRIINQTKAMPAFSTMPASSIMTSQSSEEMPF